jgi:hypothetical protein
MDRLRIPVDRGSQWVSITERPARLEQSHRRFAMRVMVEEECVTLHLTEAEFASFIDAGNALLLNPVLTEVVVEDLRTGDVLPPDEHPDMLRRCIVESVRDDGSEWTELALSDETGMEWTSIRRAGSTALVCLPRRSS